MTRLVIEDWQGLVDIDAYFEALDDEWVFRGHSSEKYRLEPTLERAYKDLKIAPHHRRPVETAVIADFKRSAHLYSTQATPKTNDTLGWLALMRHYGAPSRLLDFSYSLFVAVYFALEFDEEKPVVWAVNKSWLRRQLQELFGKVTQDEKVEKAWSRREGWVFDMIFVKRGLKAQTIAAVNPFTLNDRLVVQQGLFLCPSDVSQSFHDLLNAMKGSVSNVNCIPISLNAREQILLRLHSAGVHRAALFPGLEGFANSLRTKMLLYRHMQERREKGGRVGLPTIGV